MLLCGSDCLREMWSANTYSWGRQIYASRLVAGKAVNVRHGVFFMTFIPVAESQTGKCFLAQIGASRTKEILFSRLENEEYKGQ
jgi:hypothetical protein